MGNFQSMWVLRNFGAEQGLHPGDLLCEIKQATLADGTAEVPTQFEDGQILAVFITHSDNDTVNAEESFSTDMEVSGGAITVVGATGSTAQVSVLIIGKPKI